MGRFSNSWQTFKTSLSVARKDPELMILPVISFLATLVALGGIIGVGFLAGIFPSFTTADGSIDLAAALLSFASYIVTAFIQTFFYAAMVAGANERLGGGDPTVGSSLKAASKHIGRIFAWSLVLATVNIILQALRERGGVVGQIAASFAGMAWNLATYFVVPILLFEDAGIGGSIKRSGGLFKKTWGEQVIGNLGIGMAAVVIGFVIFLSGMVVTFLLASVLGMYGLIAGIVLTVLALLVFLLFVEVAQAAYKTALYRFATGKGQPQEFQAMDLGNAFQAKGQY